MSSTSLGSGGEGHVTCQGSQDVCTWSCMEHSCVWSCLFIQTLVALLFWITIKIIAIFIFVQEMHSTNPAAAPHPPVEDQEDECCLQKMKQRQEMNIRNGCIWKTYKAVRYIYIYIYTSQLYIYIHIYKINNKIHFSGLVFIFFIFLLHDKYRDGDS